MAMTMTGEVQLPAPRQMVWQKLNDPDVLKATIPGCESLEKTSDTSFQAVAVTKIGPVKARWKGKVTLTDLDPPNGYKIVGDGEGGVAGFAKGSAVVKLSDKDGGTLLTYNVDRGQARTTRPAADQRRGQEDGRRVFPEIRRRGRDGLGVAFRQFREHFDDGCFQRRKVGFDDVPRDVVVYDSVVVPQDIADPRNLFPGVFRILVFQRLRNVSACFRD